MGKPFYLRICGVGGQGSVHLAGTLAAAAVREGISVSVIDRPRSAMRLGPITCDLCLGQEGFAPFIVPGEADAVLKQLPAHAAVGAHFRICHLQHFPLQTACGYKIIACKHGLQMHWLPDGAAFHIILF